MLIRKMLLLLTSRVITSPFDQSLIALLIICLAYNLQVTINPFGQTMVAGTVSYTNECERLSLGTIAVSLFVSLLYTQYDHLKLEFTIGLGFLNFVVLLYLCVTVVIELRYESAIKVNRKELLRYDTEVEFVDNVLLCLLPTFSCCKNSILCQRCFPALVGLDYVSHGGGNDGGSDSDSDSDSGSNGNGDIELIIGNKLRVRNQSTYSVAFKIDSEGDLDGIVRDEQLF